MYLTKKKIRNKKDYYYKAMKAVPIIIQKKKIQGGIDINLAQTLNLDNNKDKEERIVVNNHQEDTNSTQPARELNTKSFLSKSTSKLKSKW